MTRLQGFIFVMVFRETYVASLSMCNPWNYLELKEGRDDNNFHCTGLTAQQQVTWLLDNEFLATCGPNNQPECSVIAYHELLKVSRTSETSSLSLNATKVSNPAEYGNSRLTCQAPNQDTSSVNVTCQLDSIYPAQSPNCQIQFRGDIWSVSGWCTVEKFRSSRNNYRCLLYQTSNVSSAPAQVGSCNISSLSSTQDGYYSGVYSFTSYLPPQGQYNYSVTIMPGEVKVHATFNGSNIIRKPDSVPTHNCKQVITKGETLNCGCSVGDPGSPPGVLQWNNTGSSQLNLQDVQKEKHGTNYVCSLTWNNTIVKSVNYEFIITYQPSQLSFKVNDNETDSVTVTENSTVTMLCQADGRPPPGITIAYVTNGYRILKTIPTGNVSDEGGKMQHKLENISCEASGKYKCAASNGIGDTLEKSVNLYVTCKPRRNATNGSTITKIIFQDKEEKYSFELIVYPTSVSVDSYFLGQSSNVTNIVTPANADVFHATCTADRIYSVICTLRVNRVTSNTTGFYQLIVGNGLGSVELKFEVELGNVTATPSSSQDLESNTGAIAGGVVGGLIAVGLVVAALIFFLRRKGRKESPNHVSKKADKGRRGGDNEPLGVEQRTSGKGPVLSMSPVTESEYENQSFQNDSSKHQMKGKGAKETKRRNQEGLTYTTVVFSQESKTNSPQPASEPTEYATIVGQPKRQ